MRLFHIADLHFGKIIYGRSMLEDQHHWVRQFLKICDERDPDAVLIAGDVYDRASPSGDAVELLDDLLTQLAQREIPVMMIAGNHDSGQRLAFARNMLAKEHIHIAGGIDLNSGCIEHLTLDDPDGHGPVTFWLLPYIYPELVDLALKNRTSAESEPIRTYDEALRALLQIQKIDPKHRNVILSHQNVTSGGIEIQRGGSETMVGGIGQIDAGAYADFDYAALGHIHSGYPVGRPQIRYAGTPLCYHFAETRQPDKGVVEIELGARGDEPEIKTLPIQPLHKMRMLEGTKEEIYHLLENDDGCGEYVGITITDERITPETAGYLRQLLGYRDSVLLELLSSHTAYWNTTRTDEPDAEGEQALEDLFAEFYTAQTGGMPPAEDEYELMRYAAQITAEADACRPLGQGDAEKLLQRAMTLDGGENA